MNEFVYIMPEIFLALTLALVIAGEMTYHGEQVRLISATVLIGLGSALVQTLLCYQYGPAQIFGRTISVDGLSLFFDMVFISLSGLAVAICALSKEIAEERKSEYYALIVAACLAMCIAASASDLLLAFLSLQFLNILAAFIAGFGKGSVRSTEAAIKYMVFGLVGSAMLLYGMAILLASSHSLNIYDIHRALVQNPLSHGSMLVVFMLLFMALCFQAAAFPFNLWAPDVLEGAPTPASGFLSIATRATALAVAARFFIVMFAQPSENPGRWLVQGNVDWTQIVALVSGLSMGVGSLLAFRQTSAKRMVGALMIAESGHLLLGLLVLDQVGVAAVLYNLVVQLFALMGVFYVLSIFHDELHSDRFEDLRGILKRAVPECICLVLFLVSIVGIPPLPGFIGKFALIGVAIRHHWVGLGMVAIGSSAISTLAVARLSFYLVGDFKTTVAETLVPRTSRKILLSVLILPLVLCGVFAEFVLGWAGRSLDFIFW
jgi:NADH-quinone oxidoreductase subunit N